MFQIIEYIKFLFKSTNQHGVHSPFVYDLVTKCFYDKSIYKDYQFIKSYRQNLLEDSTEITITDFGSGSRVFNSNKRAINAIAKTSGSTLKRIKLLYRITKYFEPRQSLELGTSLGMATQVLALGNPNNSIVSIEGCDQISKIAEHQLKEAHILNVDIINSSFNEILPKLANKHFDLIFFDGHHEKEATLNYFDILIKTAHNDSVFIFDDIYWSKDMKAAWKEIKAHPDVTVTVDTFFWGLVFFRNEQVKQNFKIRV
ncbi:class I SAM-dependent methyltransferase [Psychroserpens sp.]|uniref:O-methyltransferase n=1 Tax=Psychroserpens sp. TaxID=2020870 RepID=UPI001B2B892F|nr:class I SAM-dependent methyltransferase [Psychroserpens sp.]MBO6606939.1 class I SAM-dependent methyltransferase [Psychroserpens sp.]MBO6631930.1 class I SAM-dependent methyltransferase [Psychroserpens sp.]MBO6654085.1 class I SAM-dependent methyltransferase [Psychroserpens sp.]MBO6682629.1 class I SAM-dependent methyltransferase [Psychroserpens sp.]MBO6750711.1 class I SAM-dependent methyltransferase [Psychroserpens sp.]